MVAETSHKEGERGVLLAKQWLESTTHIELPFSVYEVPEQTSLVRLDGAIKRYDLSGHFLATKRPLFVEVKKYSVVGRQPEEYTEYLANAYSITARDIRDGIDRRREFMWVTWHPFSQGKWVHLTSKQEIRDALKTHPEVLDGADVNSEIVDRVSERLWLLVLNPCQEKLFLTREELYKVEQALNRKGM
ncbi:hypothetical protein ACFY30_00535 [Streptomyces sp. NPDC000345]|uniref:hypothetical protein n=1 Tax=Streptomyces sp. NPDC000345 TaxID=3364537 RepID=UPI0036917B30